MSENPLVHVFICLAENPLKKKCNNDGQALELLNQLKEECFERYGKKVRINRAGCLGKCSVGPTIVIYPQGKWYTGVQISHKKEILNDIEKFLPR